MSDELRREFLRLLTVDSGGDARRKDWNQAIFEPTKGYSIWSSTDLSMVMDKFDRAVKNTRDGGAR